MKVSPEEFRQHAREQQRRVESLIVLGSERQRRPFLFRRPLRLKEGDLEDPEVLKNLRIFRRLIEGAVGIYARGDRPSDTPMRGLEELVELIELPSDGRLTIKVLLGRRFQLERFLLEVADAQYLTERAADFYGEGESTLTTWRGLVERGEFPGQPPVLVYPPVAHSEEQTRQMLQRLIAEKESVDLVVCARRELKQPVLLMVIGAVAAATMLFGFSIGFEWDSSLIAAFAGADGAALGGLFRLRDEVQFGSQTRQFGWWFVGDVIVGAAAGLLTFSIVEGNIMQVSEEGGLPALAFVVGFSQAAFLGLVARIGGVLSEDRPRRLENASRGRDGG